jgi:hypothetical protein
MPAAAAGVGICRLVQVSTILSCLSVGNVLNGGPVQAVQVVQPVGMSGPAAAVGKRTRLG